jgi:hypothetical protein
MNPEEWGLPHFQVQVSALSLDQVFQDFVQLQRHSRHLLFRFVLFSRFFTSLIARHFVEASATKWLFWLPLPSFVSLPTLGAKCVASRLG